MTEQEAIDVLTRDLHRTVLMRIRDRAAAAVKENPERYGDFANDVLCFIGAYERMTDFD